MKIYKLQWEAGEVGHFHTFEGLSKKLRNHDRWELRLTNGDHLSPVILSGDTDSCLRLIARTGAWGSWVMTEIKEVKESESDAIDELFGFRAEPARAYITCYDLD